MLPGGKTARRQGGGWGSMRRTVLVIAALVFLAGLFLDTAGLIELSWLCVSGRCGLPVRFALPGLGLLLAGGALLLGPPPAPAAKGKRRATPGSKPKKTGAPAKRASPARQPSAASALRRRTAAKAAKEGA